MSDPLVIFTPSGRRERVPAGISVLDAARRLGVDLDSVCGGRGICGRCRVEVAAEPTRGRDPLTPWNEVEQRFADKRAGGGLGPGRRLGCQARLLADVVIAVPAESQVHRQLVRKRAEAHPIEIDPVVRLCYVEVREPDMHDPSSDLRRLQEALAGQWGLGETTADLAVLRDLQKTLRAGGWRVTVALRKGRDIVAVMPGFCARARPRLRHRLDDDRRPSLRSFERGGPRLGGRHEPADPLRRGSDEPGLLCHDESRRR